MEPTGSGVVWKRWLTCGEKRFWILVVPLVLLTIAFMVPAGDDESSPDKLDDGWRFALRGPGANETAPCHRWVAGPGRDVTPDHPMCYWDTSVTDWTARVEAPNRAVPTDLPGFAVAERRRIRHHDLHAERWDALCGTAGASRSRDRNVTELFRPAPEVDSPDRLFTDGDQVAFIKRRVTLPLRSVALVWTGRAGDV